MSVDDFRKALAKTDEIRISVKGRKSGRMVTLPVWFVHERGKLYLLSVKGSDGNWYKNLLKNPTVKISANKIEITRDTRPMKDKALLEEIVNRFKAKYGADEIKRYYSKLDAAVEVSF